MKAVFSFDEMVYNVVCKGKRIYYGDTLETIDYVKLEKRTRQIIVHCESGNVFPAMQDEEFEFEVTAQLESKKPNKKRLKKNSKHD